MKNHLITYKRQAYKKKHVHQSFVALPKLQATAVDCAHELINGEACKFLQT